MKNIKEEAILNHKKWLDNNNEGERLEVSQAEFNILDLSYIDLSDAVLEGAVFRNCNFTETNFTRCNLTNARFFGCAFNSTNFKDSCLKNSIIAFTSVITNCNFEGSAMNEFKISDEYLNINECIFNNADMNNIRLSTTLIEYSKFKGSNLFGSKLEYTSIHNSDLEDACLLSANLLDSKIYNSNLSKVKFDDAILDKVVMEKVTLDGATFKRAFIKDSSLSYIDWLNIDFTEARLVNTKLSYKTLDNIIFYRAKLADLDLSYTTFKNVSFKDAILTRVNLNETGFENVNLKGVDLSGVSFSTRAKEVLEDYDLENLTVNLNSDALDYLYGCGRFKITETKERASSSFNKPSTYDNAILIKNAMYTLSETGDANSINSVLPKDLGKANYILSLFDGYSYRGYSDIGVRVEEEGGYRIYRFYGLAFDDDVDDVLVSGFNSTYSEGSNLDTDKCSVDNEEAVDNEPPHVISFVYGYIHTPVTSDLITHLEEKKCYE